jgi:hypothetical protein
MIEDANQTPITIRQHPAILQARLLAVTTSTKPPHTDLAKPSAFRVCEMEERPMSDMDGWTKAV